MSEYSFYAEDGKEVATEYLCCAKIRNNSELEIVRYFIKYQSSLILNPYKRTSINNRNYKMREVTKDQFDRYMKFLVEKKEHQLNRLAREIC